jgi:hypothetical protein
MILAVGTCMNLTNECKCTNMELTHFITSILDKVRYKYRNGLNNEHICKYA